MWVRGLKHFWLHGFSAPEVSHPMWVRGLKHLLHQIFFYRLFVASYVGAWIETVCLLSSCKAARVASYVGAWIETIERDSTHFDIEVASYVGAWIETAAYQ